MLCSYGTTESDGTFMDNNNNTSHDLLPYNSICVQYLKLIVKPFEKINRK